MCGIAGAVGRIDPVIVQAVARASESQAHRGPDDSGAWSSIGEAHSGLGAAFGHRRLTILDLSAAGHQPMIDPDTGNVIVYNGEVYNFRELRTELKRGGVRFTSDCDTEVVLQAYRAWGSGCVEKFRGMFALGIWDEAKREVFLARDRLGIKPLYLAEFTRSGYRTLLFATELRALLATGLVDRQIDPVALACYLWNGFVIGPNTIVRGIRLLPAGSTLTVRADDPAEPTEPKRFWQVPMENAARCTTDDVAKVLGEAVKMRLVSDVPLGVFLSGGIDSSVVAALAAKSADEPIRTFNVSFDESRYDESPYASAVARALGARHTDVRLTRNEFQSSLDNALGAMDQPSFDGINTFFVSRAVREAGVTVALAGVGGDELFGGYRSFQRVPAAARWSRRLSWLPDPVAGPIANAFARVRMRSFGDMPPQTEWGKFADVLQARGDLLATYQVSYALFNREFLSELSDGSAPVGVQIGLPENRVSELSSLVQGASDLRAVSALELACFVTERLLRDIDCTSMASSLEVRVPLLDHEVIAATAGLDDSDRFKPLMRKQVLRRIAQEHLGDALADRPKSGFVLPFEVWCREALRGEVDDLLRDVALIRSIGMNPTAVHRLWSAFQRGAPGIYWTRIWSIFVLLWWCRQYGVSRDCVTGTAANATYAAEMEMVTPAGDRT